jgi:hypothetical protein
MVTLIGQAKLVGGQYIFIQEQQVIGVYQIHLVVLVI